MFGARLAKHIKNIEDLKEIIQKREERNIMIKNFQYLTLNGINEDKWDPVFNDKNRFKKCIVVSRKIYLQINSK